MVAELQLLGFPRLSDAVLPLSKLTALMAFLVLRDDWVSRDELLGLFYPDSSEADARNSLRQLLNRLNALVLPSKLEVEAKSSRVRLQLPCDVLEFRAALAAKDAIRAIGFSGVLLEGLHLADAPDFMSWLELERAFLSGAWQKMALVYARQADPSSAVVILQQILKLDSLCEEAVQLYLESGSRDEALLVYQQFLRALTDLDLQPSQKTLVLFEKRQDDSLLISTLHNLPFSSTPFVGREVQLRALHEIIGHPMSRLITVVGLGGMGKTRLALQVAHGWLEAGFDGVYLVPLVDVQHISGLPNAIATAVNMPVYSEVKSELLSLLQPKRVLLLLDNFEHLSLEVPHGFLHDLLEKCANLKILVTSRVPLGVYGEWVFHLQGFEAEDSAAMQLFWQTAQRHNPNLELNDTNSVRNIVQRLGGMPLAIELAAYWMRLLSPAEVLRELELGLKLETNSTAVPERQRAVDLMLNQSYQRLTKTQQSLLQGMCVFRGGATLEAARVVTGGTILDLQYLVEIGLLQKNNSGRFDLHELLRQFVLTQAQPLELQDYIKRHGVFFTEQTIRLVNGIEQNPVPIIAALSLEYANVEVSLEVFTHYDLQHHFARVADAYMVFLRIRGLFWVALDLMRLNLQNPDLPLAVQQQNQVFMACVLQRTYQLEASALHFEQVLPNLKPTHPTWAYAWLAYAETLLRLGRVGDALGASQTALTAFLQLDIGFNVVRTKIVFAYALYYSNQLDLARNQALEALRTAQQHEISHQFGDWYWEVGKLFIRLNEADTLKYVQGTFEFYKGINDLYSIQFIAREAKELYALTGQTQHQLWIDEFLRTVL